MRIPQLILLSFGLFAECLPARAAVQISSPDQAPVAATPDSFAFPGAQPTPKAAIIAPGQVQAFIVVGDVQLIDKDGAATPLQRGQSFPEGTTIQTGAGAQALLVFSTGATLKVLQNSTVQATAADAVQTPGKIQAFIVVGDVQLIGQDGLATPLNRGEIFEEGCTIKAGAGAQALLVFSNGATLKILGETRLSIDQFQQAPFDEMKEGTFLRLSHDPSRSKIVLDLTNGSLQGEYKQPNKAAGSTFTIKTVKGAFNIDGGFSLSISGETLRLDETIKPTTASTQSPNTPPATQQVTLMVDPNTGAITGGGISGSDLGSDTAQDLANALQETVNQARVNNQEK